MVKNNFFKLHQETLIDGQGWLDSSFWRGRIWSFQSSKWLYDLIEVLMQKFSQSRRGLIQILSAKITAEDWRTLLSVFQVPPKVLKAMTWFYKHLKPAISNHILSKSPESSWIDKEPNTCGDIVLIDSCRFYSIQQKDCSWVSPFLDYRQITKLGNTYLMRSNIWTKKPFLD